MRRGNIFEQESYRGTGVRTLSSERLTLIICSVLSGLAAFSIIANFGAVTARIAIFMANLLSSGRVKQRCKRTHQGGKNTTYYQTFHTGTKYICIQSGPGRRVA